MASLFLWQKITSTGSQPSDEVNNIIPHRMTPTSLNDIHYNVGQNVLHHLMSARSIKFPSATQSSKIQGYHPLNCAPQAMALGAMARFAKSSSQTV